MKQQRLMPEAVAGAPLALDLRRTENLLERLRGLLGRAPLQPGEALLIEHCNMVHTVGMAYAIDVVFLDRGGVIRRIAPAVPPRRMRACLSARRVIELAAGEAARRGWRVGQRLGFAADWS